VGTGYRFTIFSNPQKNPIERQQGIAAVRLKSIDTMEILSLQHSSWHQKWGPFGQSAQDWLYSW